MKKTMKLNFYNYLKVELPRNLNTNYFKKFEVQEIDKTIDVSLKILEIPNIKKEDHILVSNYMSYNPITKEIFLIDKNGIYCKSVFGFMKQSKINIECEKGFASSDIVTYIIKPLLRRVLIDNNNALIHASSFAYNNKATLIAAWAHTGKTSTLLTNIVNGAEYLGDDLSVISNKGTIKPFPSPINLFYYNLRDIPEIKKEIPLSSKLKFFILEKIATIFSFFNKISTNPNMKYLFYAGKTFFNSASHVPFKIKSNYSLNEVQMDKKVVKNILLERTPNIGSDFKTNSISPVVFAERMQQCINYEFQRFNEITTSALWVPFYKGEDLFHNEELTIYIEFAKLINPINVQIPQKMDFKNTDFFNMVNN